MRPRPWAARKIPGRKPSSRLLVAAALASLRILDRVQSGPATGRIVLDVEQVEHTPQRVIDHLLQTRGPCIKRGDRRIDDRADLGDRSHRTQMAKVERSFPNDQDEATPFL